jgi:hypothetical protein
VRKQKASAQRGLPALSPHADNRPPGTVRVVVNQPQQIFLPIEQLELLPDELALGDETGPLDERDNISRGDLVLGNLLAFASRHRPESPTVELQEPAPPVSQPHASVAVRAAWHVVGSAGTQRSWP